MTSSYTPTIKQIKIGAKAIKSTLQKRFNIEVNHIQALELSSVAHGYKDFHVASGLISGSVEAKEASESVIQAMPSPRRKYFLQPTNTPLEEWIADQQDLYRFQANREADRKEDKIKNGVTLENTKLTEEDFMIPEYVYVSKDYVTIALDRHGRVENYTMRIDRIDDEASLLQFIAHIAGKVWSSEIIIKEILRKAGV